MPTADKTRSVWSALVEKRNVMSAVVLRDIRTRFFNHGLGFLVVPLWPLAHMLVLLTIYKFMGRAAPYGDSLNVFFVTGLIPTLAFMYVSRFMTFSLLLNKPMLSFPVVKILDIMFARAFLETVGAFLTLMFMAFILTALGDNAIPNDIWDAWGAYMAALFLAISVGSMVSILSLLFPPLATIYSLFMIVVWVTSGTIFVPSNFPDAISYPLSFNPVLQCVEWMRVAFYPGYPDKLLDRQYVLMFALTSLFLGLFLERVLRRIIMEG